MPLPRAAEATMRRPSIRPASSSKSRVSKRAPASSTTTSSPASASAAAAGAPPAQEPTTTASALELRARIAPERGQGLDHLVEEQLPEQRLAPAALVELELVARELAGGVE